VVRLLSNVRLNARISRFKQICQIRYCKHEAHSTEQRTWVNMDTPCPLSVWNCSDLYARGRFYKLNHLLAPCSHRDIYEQIKRQHHLTCVAECLQCEKKMPLGKFSDHIFVSGGSFRENGVYYAKSVMCKTMK